MDQPQNALKVYRDALATFPDDTVLLAAVARVQEAIGDVSAAVQQYRIVLKHDRWSQSSS